MHREPKPAVYLAAVLASETLRHLKELRSSPSAFQAAKDAEALVRLGKRAARIAELRCNGIDRYDAMAQRVLASWTEDDEARADKAVAGITAAATIRLQRYGAGSAQAQGDPRGFVLTFKLASQRSNSIDAGVWGV
jgi:hypothetical protein